MREILFRARTLFDVEWVEGCYEFGYDAETEEPTHYMWVLNHAEKYGEMFMVVPETVGQYTGLTDKNGTKIFEGDIVAGAVHWLERYKNGVVAFRDGSFGLIWHRGDIEQFNAFTSMCNVEYEVIGNIHDSPELLEEREKT